MKRTVSYTKEQRAVLKSDKSKALFGIGVENSCEWAEHSGLIDRNVAGKLFLFSALLYKGKTPTKAFAEAFKK